MINPIVYLAGPIANTEAGESVEWRVQAADALNNRYILPLSPMRCKETLAHNAIGGDFREYADRGVFFTSQGIMARDFNDVKRADALLVNLLGARSVSVGTVMEIAWAYAMQKPVVVAIEKDGNPHDRHPMLHEAIPFRVETLDEAIDAVAVILGR